ncbi:MAG: restriction endonuclease subunit S [Bacteroidales bacterium]|nr:restriction endonuclease subunit S [Bacteroidales bacterium]
MLSADTIPNVPNLRFPGFEGEWEECTFGECCSGFDYGMNAASKPFDGEHKYIRITDIDENTSEYKEDSVVSPDADIDEHYRVNENDILFARTGASTGKTYLYNPKDGRLYFAGFLIRMKVSPQNDSRFVFYQTQTPRYKKWVQIMSMRSGQPGINSQEYSSYPIFLPKREEQERIARLLSLIDQRIAIQNKVIEHYQSLIRALMQDSQQKATTVIFLWEVLSERRELNSEGYQICSVSVSKGIVNQVEYLGRSFAAKETAHYHVVKEGDIVYTKSPTGSFPYGIIKQSTLASPVAVSPLYGVYTPITPEIGTYLHFYFCSPENTLNYLRKLIQKGAKNTINITNRHFLENTIRIPNNKSLSSTVVAIKTLFSRVEMEVSYLRSLELQRNYILNQMII